MVEGVYGADEVRDAVDAGEVFGEEPGGDVVGDASKFTDDSYQFAFELLEKAGVGVAPGVGCGQSGKRAVRPSYASSEENTREAARRLGEYVGTRGIDPAGKGPSRPTRRPYWPPDDAKRAAAASPSGACES